MHCNHHTPKRRVTATVVPLYTHRDGVRHKVRAYTVCMGTGYRVPGMAWQFATVGDAIRQATAHGFTTIKVM